MNHSRNTNRLFVALLRIHDMTGKLVYQSPLNRLGLLEVDCKDWTEGLYVASLSTGHFMIQGIKFSIAR